MALASLTDVKTQLLIPTGTTKRDAQLTALLGGVIASVLRLAKDAGIQIEKKTDQTDYLDGGDSERIFCPLRPVIAVDTIHISDEQSWTAETLLTATAYRVYPATGVIRRVDGSMFPEGAQNVRVIYDCGFDPIPDDLKMGVVMLTATFGGQAGKEGIQSERIGDYSYTLQDIKNQDPAAYRFLSPYINRLVVW